MTSHRIKFSATADEFEEDGVTAVNWLQPAQTVSIFPFRSEFTLNDITWYFELNVLPGRNGDRLHMYLMKFENNIFTPMLDMPLNEGLQINVNDELRIYPYDILPEFKDLYRFTTKEPLVGSYNLAVSAYA